MKTVFITGGSRGIGEACVNAFAQKGYSVVFTYHKSEERAARIARETGARAILCDLRSPEDIRRAIGEAGQIDVLINNAGISWVGLSTDMTDEQYREIMAVNLDAVFFACREVLPQMIARKDGAIINISSMWGRSGASCEAAYSASKAGVIGLTQALAREAGPSGIRVNAVAPGVIDTDMNAHLSASDMESLADQTPLCRIGKPQEVAAAVLFLAEANFVTCQTLGVDGGMI